MQLFSLFYDVHFLGVGWDVKPYSITLKPLFIA